MLKLAVEWGCVLSVEEEQRYLAAASAQSYLLRDVTTVCSIALRPEECFRMRCEDVRRTIPMTGRVAAQLDMRQTGTESDWVFARLQPPATSRSSH